MNVPKALGLIFTKFHHSVTYLSRELTYFSRSRCAAQVIVPFVGDRDGLLVARSRDPGRPSNHPARHVPFRFLTLGAHG